MNTGIAALVDNLSLAGKPPVVLGVADGGCLLVLPEHGRVLGLCAGNSNENFLWTNPALASAQTAREYLLRDGWCNLGGDRTWLAPEIELFIGDLSCPFDTYAVPRVLDPGRWMTDTATEGELGLSQKTSVHLIRSKCDVEVRMEKRLRLAANPLPEAHMDYAGYSQRTTLEVISPADTPIRLGIWNLLQMPSPGAMLIPVRNPSSPQRVFGAFAEGEMTATAHGVSWWMASPGADTKICLKAGALTGRAGYLRRGTADGEAELVVREFAVEPDGGYIDALWEPPHETGWAFQACCVRNGAEQFNELEYHAPVGQPSVSDDSHVWAFRGSFEKISRAMRILLGIEDINESFRHIRRSNT